MRDYNLPEFECPRCGMPIGETAFIDNHYDIIGCEHCADVRDYDSALVDAGDEDDIIATVDEYRYIDYWRLYDREAD